jgi:hypothetical protein
MFPVDPKEMPEMEDREKDGQISIFPLMHHHIQETPAIRVIQTLVPQKEQNPPVIKEIPVIVEEIGDRNQQGCQENQSSKRMPR